MDERDLRRLGAEIAAGMPSEQGVPGIASSLPLLVTVRRAAELLSVSRSQCYELVASGRLPSVRLRSSIRIPAAELNDFVGRLES